jgi:hypothetical protein
MLSSICDIGESSWLIVSGEELNREGDGNTGGVEVELSDGCTLLA